MTWLARMGIRMSIAGISWAIQAGYYSAASVSAYAPAAAAAAAAAAASAAAVVVVAAY